MVLKNPLLDGGHDESPSSSMSLRDHAAMRAAVAQQQGGSSWDTSDSRLSLQTPTRAPSYGSPLSQQDQMYHKQQESHPLSGTDTPENIAKSAQKEWRRHGAAMTQDLEERRRLDEERAGTITVRVLSAETRRDVAGKKYTTYILRIQLPSGNVVLREHRYSEFAKLNEVFRAHRIILDTSFPTKHWAGRMGNWTPSLTWAPERHTDLIEFRKIQLDVWLVHVVEKYNLGDLPHSVARSVYEFLTVQDRPPCDQENQIEQDWKWNNPLSFTLGSSIRQATSTLQQMCSDNNTGFESDQSIPLDLLHSARGLCFLTVIKGGLVISGRVGTGVLIARLPGNRWSAPCAIGTIGVGWGMLAGGDITHYLVVLTTHEAVEALLHGTVQLGAELGVAVGPVGRGATSQVSASSEDRWTVHPAYSYAHSQGLFVGISLEGSVLTTRHDVNGKFYGRSISPEEVLDLPGPKAADPLYKALDRAMAIDIPDGSFRPSLLFNPSFATASPTSVSTASTTNTSPIHGLPTIDTVGSGSVVSPIAPSTFTSLSQK